jgi:hypothetical protein
MLILAELLWHVRISGLEVEGLGARNWDASNRSGSLDSILIQLRRNCTQGCVPLCTDCFDHRSTSCARLLVLCVVGDSVALARTILDRIVPG